MRNLIETLLEWIAAADLYTDIIVYLQLYNTEHRAWATITIFSMLAPLFACQAPFLTFMREQINRDQQRRLKLRLLGFIMVTPLMLVYLTIMDLLYLFN